jgi:hypothetical protein
MASLPAAAPTAVPMEVQAVGRLVGRQAGQELGRQVGQTAGREGVRPAPVSQVAVRPSHGSESGPARHRSGGLGPRAGRADR